jgi:hypothetical protein
MPVVQTLIPVNPMRENLLFTLFFCLLVSCASAGSGVTISADGDHSYYLGEKVVFSGQNSNLDPTYLFMTGPNLPATGAKLTSPRQPVVSGSPDSFTVVKTNADLTWEYSWYTANLPLDAGTYMIYAANQPKSLDQQGADAAGVGIIVKKPFIMAEVSPAEVTRGQPFTVSGTAEGIPPSVQIWILGRNTFIKATESVNPDASFGYEVRKEVTANLDSGRYFVIVQHPMQNNGFEIDTADKSDLNVNPQDDGTWVYFKPIKDDQGKYTKVFKLGGSGSLQGSDAADALAQALSEREAHDSTYSNDTYTLIPFQVTDAGIPAYQVTVAATAAARQTSSEGTAITISADGDQSYYHGEKVVLRGKSPDADTVYLFITGPNIPAAGGNLASPRTAVISGNPDSFTPVKTKPDHTWEYSWYTAGLMLDAGTFTIYAASKPISKDQLDGTTAYGTVSIIHKKPFILADISPSPVVKGQPFTVSGTAEGDPPSVQVWIIGNNYVYTAKPFVNPDASFTFSGDADLSGKLPEGQNWLFVQHSMQDNRFDIDVSGDYVRNQKPNNGTNLFKITGPGSLQGSDAADALVAAFSEPGACDDTYTVIPFQVTGSGSPASGATPDATAPFPQTAQNPPLPFALLGGAAIIVAGAVVVWRRQ